MRRFLWNWVKKHFDLEIDVERQAVKRQARDEDAERRRETEIIVLQGFIGKPVLYFSNEVQAPVVGFGERIEFITRARCPVLIVSDYLKFEETMVMGTVRHYTDQLFHAAFTVDPNTLIALLYPSYDGHEVDKKPLGRQFSKTQAMDILQARGFCERLKAFREGRELPIPDGDRPEKYPLTD